MKHFFYLMVLANLSGFSQQLSLSDANRLASLPLKCMQQQYPNKTGQLIKDSTEIASPKQMHPAFYGCFDWHSSVHGHWSLVYLLRKYPQLERRDEIISKLKTNLSKENIDQEVAYLMREHEKSYERTYGWNWVLKLQLELDSMNEAWAKELSDNLRPLSKLLVQRYEEFLPKLLYPIRYGMHTNTAFGLTFAWDYAVATNDVVFQKSIRDNAIRLFKNDEDYPFQWEPSGTDFLSPGMEEIAIMQRVLPQKEFLDWIKKFARPLTKKDFTWETAKVSDRTDGHLVHLDGLNFSRAWNFYSLIRQYPKEFGHLKKLADEHLNFSLPAITDGNYEGEHWLATFALHAFEERSFLKD
ncbi:DUF2891 domain-containing protein [Flavobacterium silvaticum]|uniref:DUF2891 domain-containing protein n=1 Tax=Flavobacterium silvaticum TaxID=1852020 RepID=A0A972FQE4_9FLAO|nr:DUF2891 domain-containing protein [Flavobacterium silvaticum]NMH29455.1 DUF2891 domain-containing protein [Flavobacterium silvaticum]